MGSYFDGSQSGPFAGDPRMSGRGPGGGQRSAGSPPSGFTGLPTSSFADFLASHSPDLLPGRAVPADADPRTLPGQAIRDLPHATTIVAAVCDHGVVLAGDRRATAGSMIAKRDVEKVFRSDEFSAMGYAGTGSVGIEFVRLFQVELEHYEKMEGRSLSLEGKANRLAWMVRGNLAAAMQGLVVVPLFVGLRRGLRSRPDLQLRRGRRPVRGAEVLLHRLGVLVRPGRAEEALRRRHAGA